MPIPRHAHLLATLAAAALLGCGPSEEPAAKAVEPAAKSATPASSLPPSAAAALSIGGSPFAAPGTETVHAPPAPPRPAK